ncbi:hypothetical protein C8R43DRAFT_621682 [Mycena crocata]|nr:hypothetical protein C8R43DRAFT_621682 [Mycena crocata]
MAYPSGVASAADSTGGGATEPGLSVESDSYDVLTLPNEIVSEIFMHFLPEYPLCPPPTGLLSPALLTRICRTWREIAVQTPPLWRAFKFKKDRRSIHGHDEEMIRLSKTWLERSGSCPLSIEADDDEADDGSPHILFDVVFPHLERLEYARLKASHFVRHPFPVMPALRRLHLKLDVPGQPEFPSLPMLRAVSLGYLLTEDDPESIIVLPWAQLTSLSLQWVFPAECTPILQQAVNLVHCELAIQNPDFGRTSSEPDVELLRLESLVLISGQVGQFDTHCLGTFIVPALHTLHISGGFLTPDPIATLTSFIANSGCKLQKLCIAGNRVLPKTTFRNAFPGIPKLSFNKRWKYWEREHDQRADEEDSD